MAKRSKKKTRLPEVAPTPRTEVTETRLTRSPAIKGKLVLQALLIVAAGLWVFWPALHGGWIGDDRLYLTGNSLLHDPARLWKAWFQPGSFIEYYPIEESVQWVQWQLCHNDTFGYHLTNVILHLVSALLVWRLFSKLGLRLAWLGGLLFAIHPAQVESVALISELKNTLSLPPFLLALCAWIEYEEKKRPRDYALALGLFLVAMLCKISMALFPFVILLYAWWKRDRIAWGDLKAGAPFFAISLALGLTTIGAGVWFQELQHRSVEIIPLGGLFSRLALVGLTISFYLSKCFWPVGLLPLYPLWKIDPPSLLQFLPWPVLGGATYLLWTKRTSWGRPVLLGLGFFLITLAPFLGFNAASYMRFTWVMDHFLYIPIIGWTGLVVAGLGQMRDWLSATVRPYGAGLVAVAMTLLAWESHRYAGMFVSEETLCRYTLEHNPGASLAHNNLGLILDQAGRVPEAMEQYQQALQINPDYVEAHANLGLALQQEGRASEAIEQLAAAARLDPHDPQWHKTLGGVLMNNGRVPEAIEQYQQALQANPVDAEAYSDLGTALAQGGKFPEAIEQYERALSINPDDVVVRNNIGLALEKSGRTSEAIDHFEAALRINPDNAVVHNNLGLALQQAGRIPEAMRQFEAATRIDPDYVKARNNLEQLQKLPGTAPANKGTRP